MSTDAPAPVPAPAPAQTPPPVPAPLSTNQSLPAGQTATVPADAGAGKGAGKDAPVPGPLFIVRVAKADGAEFAGPARFKATQREARSLIMDLQLHEGGEQPTREQMEMYAAIGRVLSVLDRLYPEGRPGSEERFRPYFVGLFELARLALEGDWLDGGRKRGARLQMELAKNELLRIEKSLLDDEEGGVKNAHLRELAKWSLLFSAPLALAYMLLGTSGSGDLLFDFVTDLDAQPQVLARYCLLWIGCFVGVCLSYAYRKPRLALEDLVFVEADRLNVPTRLLLAGLSTMLLVMLCAFGIVDITIGSELKLSALSLAAAKDGIEMFAFVVGAICGIGELALSGLLTSKLKSVLPGAGK